MSLSLLFLSLILLFPSGGETSWRKIIADKNEPGEWMIISGVVLRPDGKTPAPGVSMTVYHTDAKGIYPPEKPDDGSQPRLRGTLVTNEKGMYEIRTIRPGSYPGRQNPAHVHYIVHLAGGVTKGDELQFADDPIVPERMKRPSAIKEFTGDVQVPVKTKDGTWKVRKDILLEK